MVESGKLVVYSKKENENEAKKSMENLQNIVQDEYKKSKPEQAVTRLTVKPWALLETPDGSRWSLVDWFQKSPNTFPGI